MLFVPLPGVVKVAIAEDFYAALRYFAVFSRPSCGVNTAGE